jgi:hypothetical protein
MACVSGVVTWLASSCCSARGWAKDNLRWTFPDLVVLPLAMGAASSRWIDRHGRTLVAGSAALWGAIAFGRSIRCRRGRFSTARRPLVRILEDWGATPDHLVADHFGRR